MLIWAVLIRAVLSWTAQADRVTDEGVSVEGSSEERSAQRRKRRHRGGRRGSKRKSTERPVNDTADAESFAESLDDGPTLDSKPARKASRDEDAVPHDLDVADETDHDHDVQPADDHDDHHDDDHHDDDHDPDEPRAARGHQRDIPAWEEAIGVIVSANMEARAKNPKAGQQRGRGRDQRPRGRGNSGRNN